MNIFGLEKVENPKRLRIAIDLGRCVACRTCMLACSYHHHRLFNLGLSSINLDKDTVNGEIIFSIKSTCDHCGNEKEPLCVKYCIYKALSMINDR